MRGTLAERFWDKVEVRGEDECWPWRGARNSAGYGTIAGGPGRPKLLLAHRVSAELARLDPAPVYDHTCHTTECRGGIRCPHRACQNPRHLSPSDRTSNFQRGNNPGAPFHTGFCSHGHDLAEVGIYYTRRGYGECRMCRWVNRDPERRRSLVRSGQQIR